VTDLQAPRHENISAFFIPKTYRASTHAAGPVCSVTGQKWEVICEDVRCPADRLIGARGKGWQVSQATLSVERGGEGMVVSRTSFISKIIDYCKKNNRNGQPLSCDPAIQDMLVEMYIEHVSPAWGLRNYAMAKGQISPERYTGTQSYLHQKRFSPRMGRDLIGILGPLSLLVDPELQLLAGEVEYQIRNCDCTHFGGTPEMQQIMMARGLGLGRGARAARK
jgi:alkylation response protein AidB-like acyl-CoA dehydrogenase